MSGSCARAVFRRGLLFGGTAVIILPIFGAASAADLLNSAPPVMPVLVPAPYNWTGFYAGVNAGFGVDHFAFPFAIATPGGAVTGTSAMTSSGPVAGGQIGYNYQFFNDPVFKNVVVGAEADLDWASLRGTSTIPTGLGTLTTSTHFEDFGTLRGRVGYAFDRALFYVTGGLTFGTANNSFTLGPPSNLAGSSSFTHTGFIPHTDTVGAGVEYAFMDNWSVKGEYLYDFITAGPQSFTPVSGSTVSFGSRASYHIVRFGLNYKFDWSTPLAPPTPVVARY